MGKNCKGNMQPREIDITLYSLEIIFKNTRKIEILVRLFENIFITCLQKVISRNNKKSCIINLKLTLNSKYKIFFLIHTYNIYIYI